MNQSVAELFERYLFRCNASDGTIEVKSRAFRHFNRWYEGVKPDELTPEVAEDFQSLLLKTMEPGSVNCYLACLKPFWQWLTRMQYVSHDPFRFVKRLDVEQKVKVTFTPQELDRMIQISDVRWRVLIGLGLLGLRRGESLNLTVRDVFLTEGHLLVTSKKAAATTWPWKIKSNAERIVPLPEVMEIGSKSLSLVADLVCLMEALPANQPYICPRPGDYTRNMGRQKAGTISYHNRCCPWGNFPRDFTRLQRRAGVATPRRYHELRAAFATAMIKSHDLSTASKLLGHASVQTTNQYNRYETLKLVAGACASLRNCYVTNET